MYWKDNMTPKEMDRKGNDKENNDTMTKNPYARPPESTSFDNSFYIFCCSRGV